MGLVLGVVLALVAAIAWGVNSIIMKKAAEGEAPGRALFIRGVSSAPTLLILALLFEGWNSLDRLCESDAAWLVFTSAMTVTLGDYAYILALKKAPVSVVLPVSCSYPLFAAAYIISAGLEEVTSLLLVGTVIVVVGIMCITQQVTSNSEDRQETEHTATKQGIVFAGLAAAIWGAAVLQLRILLSMDGVDPFSLTTIRAALIGLAGLLIYVTRKRTVGIVYEKSDEERRTSVKQFLLTGVIGWTIGGSAFMYAIQHAGALVATPLTATNPMIATALGVSILGERVSLIQCFGIFLVILGSVFVTI